MQKMHFSKTPKKLFYGYWVVVAAFLCLFINSGCGVMSFSLFVKPLQADLGWSRSEVMAAFSIFFLVTGVAAAFIGRIVDRYGVRRVILIGAIVVGLGFVSLSQMHSLYCFYISYAITGVGMAGIGQVPASTVVSNWFKKRRGLAIGIMSAGIGGGGFALAPLIGGYLIPNFGWRVSYLALALLALVVIIPLALLVIKAKPMDIGLYPDGVRMLETPGMSEARAVAPEGLTAKMTLTTLAFWLIAVSFLLSGLSQMGIMQSQVPYFEDIGFSAAMAATALGLLGMGSAIAKFGFGWLCDWIPAKYACSIGLCLQLVGIIILMSIGPASPKSTIWLYAITMGLGIGSWLPTMSMLVSTHFGLSSYGTIFGAITVVQYAGCAAGPVLAAFIYDTMGSYHLAFVVFLALYIIATPVILLLRSAKSFRFSATIPK